MEVENVESSDRERNEENHQDTASVFSSSSSSDDDNVEENEQPAYLVTGQRRYSLVLSTGKASDSSEFSSDKSASNEESTTEKQPEVVTKKPTRFINIYTYCAVVSFVEFWYFFYLAYTIAVITSIEKRYGWSSIYSGLFVSSFEIGHVTIIIFSFTETNIHIPRRLAIRGFFMAFGSLLAAAPHFFVSVPSDNKNIITFGQKDANVTTQLEMLNCFKNSSQYNCASYNSTGVGEDGTTSDSSVAVKALVMLVTAQIVVATASSTYHVVSILYIDNNVDKSKSPMLIGVVYCMMMLGPAAAFLFSSWVAGSVYVNPSEPFPPLPEDPSFVGAWWIGFILCSGVFILAAPFLFFFPKKFEQPETHSHHHHHHHSSEKSKSDLTASQKLLEKLPTDKAKEASSDNQKFSLKSIPQDFVILFRNTVYLALVFMACMQTYFIAGFSTFYPKYLETRFVQTTNVANFVSGFANPIPFALGTFLGGYLMSKMKLSQSATLMYAFVFTFILACGLFVPIVLHCENDELLGIKTGSNATALCGCDKCPNAYDPICTSEHQAFVSPCHAGCEKKIVDMTNDQVTYASCGCSSEISNMTTAVSGRCNENSLQCANFYIYNVLIFILSVLICLPSTPLTVIMMRVVGERYKSWSVGLTSSFCSFLAFIPGPVIYGALFDAHCVYWENIASESSSSSGHCTSSPPDGEGGGMRHCAVYDTGTLAIWFHVVTSGFMFISLPANLYAWWKCRQQEKAAENNKNNNSDEPAKTFVA